MNNPEAAQPNSGDPGRDMPPIGESPEIPEISIQPEVQGDGTPLGG